MVQQNFLSHPPERFSPRKEPLLNVPFVVVAILLLTIGIHVYLRYFLSEVSHYGIIWRFGFVPAVFAGDYSSFSLLSVVSYSFLHGDWLHLGLNMVWFVIFGAPLANRIGAGRFLLLWLLTAILAALTHFILHSSSPTPMIGASGAVSAIMGAAARYGFRRASYSTKPVFSGAILPILQLFRERHVVVFISIWLIVNLASGLYSYLPQIGSSTIAWEAHIGGLVAGFFVIGLLDKTRY